MALWLDYGFTNQPMGRHFTEVETLEQAHEIVAGILDKNEEPVSVAFVIEHDGEPRNQRVVISEFREVWDRSSGWRKPYLTPRHIKMLDLWKVD